MVFNVVCLLIFQWEKSIIFSSRPQTPFLQHVYTNNVFKYINLSYRVNNFSLHQYFIWQQCPNYLQLPNTKHNYNANFQKENVSQNSGLTPLKLWCTCLLWCWQQLCWFWNFLQHFACYFLDFENFLRYEQDSNLCRETPLDFESNALTTRPSQL